MNQRLVICLGLSVLFGAAGALGAASVGLGWIGGFMAYSLCGSLALVGSAAAAHRLTEDASIAARVKAPAFS